MTAWYREPRTRLVHRGRLHLGVVSGACGREFAPAEPEITLPSGQSPPEHGCPTCVTGRADDDHPARTAAPVRARRRWGDGPGWAAGLAAVIGLVALVGFVVLAWPR